MHRYAPALLLFLVAPVVGEILLGATPISRLGGLVPLSAVYGGGALLIRELARRGGSGWRRIALLGAAYGIIEEGLAVQSLFNPTLFHAGELGGRALGVNWLWTEWTIGYHIVWSITIPIVLVELLYPNRRDRPWLGTLGLISVGVLYTLGVVALCAIFRVIVTPDFHTPLPLAASAVLVPAFLVALALRHPPDAIEPSRSAAAQKVPGPLLLAGTAFVASGLWFRLLALPDVLRRGPFVLLPMIAAAMMAGGLSLLIRRWSASDVRWTDLHRLALAAGAMVASMMFGFFVVTASNRIDHLGQGVICVAAGLLLAAFARALQRQRQGVFGS